MLFYSSSNAVIKSILRMLQDPHAIGVDLDSPENTIKRINFIKSKIFLKNLYMDWYRLQRNVLPDGEGEVLELGSGGGFFHEVAPSISTDVFYMPQLDIVLRAEGLPFKDRSLRAITMTNVLHHIPDVTAFFAEAARVLRPGGVIAMIEPWITPWSKWVYKNLHHEPFDLETMEWSFPPGGPLSSANEALPYIIFERDKPRFNAAFPKLQLQSIRILMPFSYLFSGGVSFRSLMPGFLYRFVRTCESQFEHLSGMFSFIVLKATE